MARTTRMSPSMRSKSSRTRMGASSRGAMRSRSLMKSVLVKLRLS